MRSGLTGSTSSPTLRGLIAIAALSITVSVPVHSAEARALKNFVTDLFGGQGITITDPGEGAEVLSIGSASIQTFGTVGSSVTQNLSGGSLSSAVAATRFDITQGLPITSTESLGPIIGERAETLGKGRYDFGVDFSRVVFTRLNNASLDNLTAIATPADCGALTCDDEVNINMKLHIEREVANITAAYGITSQWDVGIILPIVRVVATANATALLTDNGHDGDTFPNGSLTQQSSSGGTATGIGDVVLRSKYNFLRNASFLPDMAAYGELQLPTGDQNNLLGTGNTELLGELVVSKQLGAIAPHLNIGYQMVAGKGNDIGNMRYSVGADATVASNVTLGADIVGRRNDTGLNTVDFAIGGKWAVFPNSIVSAAFLVPINRGQGLRPDYAWTLRWEIGL
jgi:hypothetical protein